MSSLPVPCRVAHPAAARFHQRADPVWGIALVRFSALVAGLVHGVTLQRRPSTWLQVRRPSKVQSALASSSRSLRPHQRLPCARRQRTTVRQVARESNCRTIRLRRNDPRSLLAIVVLVAVASMLFAGEYLDIV